MPYSTGTVLNIGQLRTAITDACVVAGWTFSDNILSKGDCFIKITEDSANDRIVLRAGLGQSGSTLLNSAPLDTYIMRMRDPEPFAYPMTYFIHAIDNEVYVVIKWNSVFFLTFGFGQSPIDGMVTGKGVWVSGTAYSSGSSGGFTWSDGALASAGSTVLNARTGLFLTQNGNSTSASMSAGSYMHHGFPDWSSNNLTGVNPSNTPMTVYGSRQLNFIDNPAVNPTGQTVLCPIQPYMLRGSNKSSIVADLKHARYIRLDTLNSEDVITYGSDSWKVYPIYKRDSTNRNGSSSSSGTFGYAFRYDGA